jgi:ribosomal protein S18 acetylase RimI-like enzyme
MTRPSDGQVSVRRREQADLSDAGAALVEVHRSDGYPVEGVDDPVAWLLSPHQIAAWVAELDGLIVGHVAVGEPQSGDAAATAWAAQSEKGAEQIAVLGRLFVHPQARGHALGEQLARTATDYAHEHGLRLVLDVMTKDAAAIRLYERLGWQRIGTTQHDDGHAHTIDAYCYVSPIE